MTCVHFLQYLELKVVLLYHYLSIILCIYAWLTCILFELPLSSPFPGVLSMFVMDNARIHHGEGILELAEIHGKFVEIYSITRAYFYSVNVRIEFLPPYSPDLNLIEEAFLKVKAFICCNWALLVYEGDGLLFDLIEIMDVVTASNVISYFLHAGNLWMNWINWSIM